MTRPAEVPSEARARRVLEQYVAACQANGKRPSTLGLASQLGLRNTTFRRHFPDLAKEIAAVRSTPATGTQAEGRPTPYDVLVARNAKLQRANRILADNLRLAGRAHPTPRRGQRTAA